MMSLSTIRAISQEIAEVAAQEGRVPFVPEAGDIATWRSRWENDGPMSLPFPNLGSHEPDGWELTDEGDWFFVDKSGFGASDEPALTVPQFLNQLEAYHANHPGYGYAIVEEGPFQVFVAPFRKL